MSEGYRQPEALPQRKADQSVLLEATGRAPVPFWWNSPDSVPMIAGRRPSVPHAAYAAAALEPPAGTSSTVPKPFDTYVHWLYAQNLGYQGFRVALNDSNKSMVLTTPPPTKDHLAGAIAARQIKLPGRQELFDQFEYVLSGFEREAPLASQTSEDKTAPKAQKAPKKKRSGPRQRAARVTWKPKKEEPPPPGKNGSTSLQLLQDMYEAGNLTENEYAEAIRTVKQTVKGALRKADSNTSAAEAVEEPVEEKKPDPQPEEEHKTEDPQSVVETEPSPESQSEPEIVPAEGDVDEEVRVVDPAQEEAEEEDNVEPPAVSISDALSMGVAVDLLPYECEFEVAAELSFDIGNIVQDYQGDALLCVLRQDPKSGEEDEQAPWSPLDSSERVSLSESGLVTVELHSFCRIMVVWMASLHPWHTRAMVDTLAAGLLANMESRGRVVDAGFRMSFQLGSVCPLQVGLNESGSRWISQLPEIQATIQAKVSAAVFADSERREAEAAAAAEARRLEEEAAGAEIARVAALPLLLKEAAKKGPDAWAADKEANPDGITMEQILADPKGQDLHLWQDESGYTALYAATMYEQEKAVALLIDAGSEIDRANNNGVTPLMAAARDGFTNIVKMLLEAGADFAQIDEFGRTADSVAEEKGFAETASVVKEWAEAHSK